jgi:hypothetical protein
MKNEVNLNKDPISCPVRVYDVTVQDMSTMVRTTIKKCVYIYPELCSLSQDRALNLRE